MQPVEIRPSIYWIGVNDRHTELFEGLWTIQDEGISYNSYLILDEKNVLIDITSKFTTDELLDQVRSLIEPEKLNYIVINHMEPDHTGGLKALLLLAPRVKLLGTAKTKEMLASFYNITENVQVVADGEELILGKHTLKFVSTPFVHWPETMMTFETTERVLFSCDGFGGYGTLNGTIFDDKTCDIAYHEKQALRYFVNIVSSFTKPVKNAVAKLNALPIDVVAPSHGLVWRNSPRRIIDLYAKWAGYAGGAGDPAVTLLYASMYGNTERLMEVIAQGIVDEGIQVRIFNVVNTSMADILPVLWLNAGVMIGAPTYEGGMFPYMSFVLELAQRKHIFNKIAASFGSYAWSGGAKREYEEKISALRWKSFGTYEFKGTADPEELTEGRAFGASFARGILTPQ